MVWYPSVRTRHLLIVSALIIAVAAALTIVAITRVINIRLAARQEAVRLLSDQILGFSQEAILQNPSQSEDEAVRDAHAREAIQNNASVRQMLRAGTGNGEFTYFAIISSQGETIVQEDPQEIRKQPERISPIEEFEGARKDKQWFALRNNDHVYEFTREIRMRDKLFGKIIAGVPVATLAADLQPPFRLLMIVGLIVGGLALLVAVITSNLVLQPLRELMKSIEQLEAESAPDASASPSETIAAPKEASNTSGSNEANSVTQRLRVLGKRFAGNRLEMESLRDQLRQVVSNVSERVVLLDRERRVLMASPEAEKLLGNGHLSLRGKIISEALGADHPLNRLTQQAFSERQSLQETTAVSANGDRPQMVVASVQLFEEQGRPAGALVTLRDFESLRQLETQLDSATRIAALSRITSGVAHEVRNPLHAMVLHLELLNTKLQSGGDPQTHIQVLTSEVNRLNRVVQTFLDFTRPVELKLVTTDANALVREVMLLAADARRDGIEIIEQYTDGPLYVKADSDLLKQAILNIVLNGCQAMPDGGRLTVSVQREPAKNVVISIRDEGPGISPEVREKIFNLYYTTKPNGTGIGLALTFRAVQLHNARIEVESEPGAGACFRITLPPG